MASKTTPSLNEAIKRRSKRSTAGINSRYTETPSPSTRKLKSTPLNSTAKNSNKKNTITSEKKSSSFSGDIDSHTSLLKEIKHFETRLENQISKTNLLEEELDKLKQENLSIKTELTLQLDNIKLTINNDNNNNKSDVLNSMSNSGSIKTQTTNNSNIPNSTITKAEQSPTQNISNIDFNVVRDITATDQSTSQTGGKKVFKNGCTNTMHTPRQSNYSNTVSGNAAYTSQPSVKHKTNHQRKRNLFIIGDSHIKRIKRDLIVHHLSDKNISLKCKNFDGADVRRIQHHLLPSLHEDQVDSIIIHGGTNDFSSNKLHITRPHDLAKKLNDIGNVCKSFGVKKIAISSILPRKDQECQKRIDETNNYLKELCGFYGFSFIDNSSITENYLHHDEIHLKKVGSFLLGQNFVGHFNKSI